MISQLFDIKIDDECLTQVASAKDLGAIFDASLTWTNCMNEVYLVLGEHLIPYIYSLIYPFLTYSVHVWGLNFPLFLKSFFSYTTESNYN